MGRIELSWPCDLFQETLQRRSLNERYVQPCVTLRKLFCHALSDLSLPDLSTASLVEGKVIIHCFPETGILDKTRFSKGPCAGRGTRQSQPQSLMKPVDYLLDTFDYRFSRILFF